MNSPEYILYRWWDASGDLLYVGKSISMFARIAAHRKSSAFFPAAESMTIERFSDAAALSVAEVKAIREEHPLHNVVHNGAPGTPRNLNSPARIVASHWSTIDGDAIEVGDLIRHIQDDEVVLQGLVDEELWDCNECDDPESCIGWIVWADDGTVHYVHESDFVFGDLEKWVSVDTNDETKSNAFGAWLHGRARLGYMAGVA